MGNVSVFFRYRYENCYSINQTFTIINLRHFSMLHVLYQISQKIGRGYIVWVYLNIAYEYSLTPLRKNCPYSELFWSAFSRIRTEYGEILSPNVGKCGPEQIRIRALFPQCLVCYYVCLVIFIFYWIITK